MSLFHVGLRTKEFLDSHNILRTVLTGSYLGNFVVEKILKNTGIYLYIQDLISTRFANHLAPGFKPVSRHLAKRALKPRKGPKENVLEKTLHSSNVLVSPLSSTLVSVIGRITQHADTILQPKILETTRNIIVSQLEPICEKAVHQGFIAMLKSTGDSSIDFVCKNAISTLSWPFFYKYAIKWPLEYIIATENIEQSKTYKYLPEVNTVLWSSIAVHGVILGFSLWQSTRPASIGVEGDKPKIKRMIFDLAKEPISKHINESRLLSLTRINKSAKRVDAITRKLINKLVDLYWHDLKELNILGFPIFH